VGGGRLGDSRPWLGSVQAADVQCRSGVGIEAVDDRLGRAGTARVIGDMVLRNRGQRRQLVVAVALGLGFDG
jgi:hypothetical protein